MGNIDKYGLDRLYEKKIDISFKCPKCKSERIELKSEKDIDYWVGVRCSKCGVRIILDNLSIAVIKEPVKATV